MKIVKETNFQKVETFLTLKFSSPTHWPDWNLVISKYFNTEFFYFAVYEENEIIGIMPVHQTNNGFLKNLYSGQFHFLPFGGWLLSKKFEPNINDIPISSRSMIIGYGLPVL